MNEDSSSALAGTAPLFVIADGVGGGAMAALASRELILRLHGALERSPIDAPAICAALLDADRDVARSIARYGTKTGAATVAVCAATSPRLSKWLVAWVGDCRVYKLAAASDRSELLTRDDTYRNLGEEPPPASSPDDPARMVGNGAVIAPNIVAVHSLGRDEMLALCSDGIHKHVDGTDWCSVLDAPVSLAQRGQALVALARKRGSVDDATVLLLHRSDPEPRNPRWRGRAALPFDKERSER